MKELILKLYCLIGAFALANAVSNEKPLLKGVTIPNNPFTIYHENKTFSGFTVDLINKISEQAGFNYELYITPDYSYGREIDGKMNGIIGEIASKKADFASADLTVTQVRKKHVDFTESFMSGHLKAVVQRQFASNASTLEDLVHLKDMQFGVLRSGFIRNALRNSSDTLGQTIVRIIDANSETALVRTNMQGIDRVHSGPYALIVGSAYADFIAAKNCKLVALPDNRKIVSWEYAMALQKNSKFLPKFNDAIRKLKSDGLIDELQKKYWARKC